MKRYGLFLLAAANALKTYLPAGETNCITVRAAPQAQVLLNYEGIPAEHSQLEVTAFRGIPIPLHQVYSKMGEKFFTSEIAKSGSANFTSHLYPDKETSLEICFQNKFRGQPIFLFFSTRADRYEHLHDVASIHHAEGIKKAVQTLSMGVKQLLDQQSFAMTRGHTHSEIIGGAQRSLIRWTLVQAGFLLSMAVLQTALVKHWFNDRKTLL